jgi:AcrR family transcriptional regulator
MERIAQEAGISKGTIYLYFESKESLLLRAIEHGFDQPMDRTRAAARRGRSYTTKVREVVGTAVQYSFEYRSFYRALAERLDLRATARSPRPDRLRETIVGYVGYVADLLERGMRAGEFRAIDPHRAARFLVSAVRTIIDQQIQDTERPLVQEEIDALLDLFLHGVATGEKS